MSCPNRKDTSVSNNFLYVLVFLINVVLGPGGKETIISISVVSGPKSNNSSFLNGTSPTITSITCSHHLLLLEIVQLLLNSACLKTGVSPKWHCIWSGINKTNMLMILCHHLQPYPATGSLTIEEVWKTLSIMLRKIKFSTWVASGERKEMLQHAVCNQW